MSLKIVKVEEVKHYIEKQNVVLVDIRERQDYDEGNIPGSVHVSVEHVEAFVKSRCDGKFVILYCERGITSIKVANRLSKMGFRMGTLAGGFATYKKSR